MPNISEKNINEFLHFGWLPRLDIPPPFPEEWIPLETKNTNPSLTEGANILREAVARQVPEKEVVVPLSGGFDSRAMLAILHEQGKDITAVTLGVPGTYDFEIGKLVAKKMRIKHEAVNVNEINLSTNEIVSFIQKIGDWPNAIEVFYNLYIAKIHSGKPIVSGFLGDFLAGSYSQMSSLDNVEARNQFCKDNNVSRAIRLTSPDFKPDSSLPAEIGSYSTVSPYEELVYRTRHTCSMRPTAFETDFGYVTPFRDEQWIKFILSCTSEFRLNQKFYQQMLLENWPSFFTLPSKNYKGAAINSPALKKRLLAQKARVLNKAGRMWPRVSNAILGIDKMLNYTDFNNQIANNQNLRAIFIENLSDLEKRNCTPWLDTKEMNKNLLNEKKVDYNTAVALLNLVNLEINLKASICTIP